MKKLMFFIAGVFMLVVVFAATIKTTPIPFILSTEERMFSFIQRNLGLIALNLIFIQIILSVFTKFLVRIFGTWIYKLHVIEGVFAYILAFLHPVFYLITLKVSGQGFDPYIAFVNACLLCKTPYDYYLTIGRISFWLLTISVFTAIFKKTNNWLTKYWNKLHMLNYLVFLLVVIHGFLLGADFRSLIILTLVIVETLIVLAIILFKEFPKWLKDFRSWLSTNK